MVEPLHGRDLERARRHLHAEVHLHLGDGVIVREREPSRPVARHRAPPVRGGGALVVKRHYDDRIGIVVPHGAVVHGRRPAHGDRDKRLQHVTLRRRKRDHRDVAVVAPRMVVRIPGARDAHLRTFAHLRTGDGQLAHRLVHRHPRAARHRPARAAVHQEAQSQPAAFVPYVADEVVPVGAHARDGVRDAGPRAGIAERLVEQLDAAEARRGDRLEVERHPLLAGVAARYLHPRLRTVGARRGLEAGERSAACGRRERGDGGNRKGEVCFHVPTPA